MIVEGLLWDLLSQSLRDLLSGLAIAVIVHSLEGSSIALAIRSVDRSLDPTLQKGRGMCWGWSALRKIGDLMIVEGLLWDLLSGLAIAVIVHSLEGSSIALAIHSLEGSSIALAIHSLEGSSIALAIHSLEGSSIALAIHSLDPSLSAQLIAPYNGPQNTPLKTYRTTINLRVVQCIRKRALLLRPDGNRQNPHFRIPLFIPLNQPMRHLPAQ